MELNGEAYVDLSYHDWLDIIFPTVYCRIILETVWDGDDTNLVYL